MKTTWIRLRRETGQRKGRRPGMEGAGEQKENGTFRGEECRNGRAGGAKSCSRPHERVNHHCSNTGELLILFSICLATESKRLCM